MADYTKATNFTAKDALPTGNTNKIVKGAEIDTEFTAIASAVSSKADLNSPAFTGTPTAPTASSITNTTQIATTAFVKSNLGTIASQNANNVAITGGSITGITDLAVADGGTGQSTYSAGQLLIGNSAGGLTKATLTAGTNVTITNGNGAITIAASGGSGGSGTVTSVATGNGLSGGTITTTGTLTIAAPSANSIGSYAYVSLNIYDGITNTVSYGSNYAAGNGTQQLRLFASIVGGGSPTVDYTGLSGTWKWLGATSSSSDSSAYTIGIAVRVS